MPKIIAIGPRKYSDSDVTPKNMRENYSLEGDADQVLQHPVALASTRAGRPREGIDMNIQALDRSLIWPNYLENAIIRTSKRSIQS
jgi:hypothetical protein